MKRFEHFIVAMLEHYRESNRSIPEYGLDLNVGNSHGFYRTDIIEYNTIRTDIIEYNTLRTDIIQYHTFPHTDVIEKTQ